MLCVSVFTSCKKEIKSESDQNITSEIVDDGLTLINGDFIFYADAAVLQTNKEIYGVIIDDKMHELDRLVNKYKKETTDMVPVQIKGKIIPKNENEEGWDYKVEIKEILSVFPPKPETNDVIKVGEE